VQLGLTGGIACGKSTVANMLVRKGAALIDADLIAREVVEPGTPGLLQVAEAFGSEVILPNGGLDRKKLGSIIFGDEATRLKLNGILHPLIRAEMKKRMEAAAALSPDKLVVVDVPLLFESRLASMFEAVMVVYVPESVQLERLMSRDGCTTAEAEARIRSQMPIEEKKRLADIVIDNSGTMMNTAAQIEAFWEGNGLK